VPGSILLLLAALSHGGAETVIFPAPGLLSSPACLVRCDTMVVGSDAQVPPPPPRRGRFKFVRQVGSDFQHLPSWDTAAWLAGGGALALAVHPGEDGLNGRLAANGGFWRVGKTLGSVYVQAGAGGLTYLVGRNIKNDKVKHLGTDLLSAQIVAQTVTQGIKFSVRRDRPDHSNSRSFPSGHASSTFASATVLQRHLGWKAAVPTYTVATFVALSRLHENRHFLSDVVFGAAIGVAAGRTTTRHGRTHWAFTPDVGRHGAGVIITRVN
jgi:membrane-associated phospholipid phosphatase